MSTASAALTSSRAAASKQHSEGGKEQEDQSRQHKPDSHLKSRSVSIITVIDLVADDSPRDKVGDGDNEGDQEGTSGEERGDEGANNARSECGEEGDEREAAGDCVQYLDASQALGSCCC